MAWIVGVLLIVLCLVGAAAALRLPGGRRTSMPKGGDAWQLGADISRYLGRGTRLALHDLPGDRLPCSSRKAPGTCPSPSSRWSAARCRCCPSGPSTARLRGCAPSTPSWLRDSPPRRTSVQRTRSVTYAADYRKGAGWAHDHGVRARRGRRAGRRRGGHAAGTLRARHHARPGARHQRRRAERRHGGPGPVARRDRAADRRCGSRPARPGTCTATARSAPSAGPWPPGRTSTPRPRSSSGCARSSATSPSRSSRCGSRCARRASSGPPSTGSAPARWSTR